MRKSRLAWVVLVLLLGASGAQVLTPSEIKDPELSSLQLRYMDDLRQVGQDILASHFDYPFYLSRRLDLDEADQKRMTQRSIRFDRYNGQTVLAITGNYYAAYSGDKISSDQRARSTFLNVVMPVLQAAVPRFQTNHQIQGYAVEIAHHILGKVMGVSMERPENLMVYLPQGSAIRLLAAKDDTAKQAAVLQGQVFLNAQPITIWLNGEGPPPGMDTSAIGSSGDQTGTAQVSTAVTGGNSGQAPASEPTSPAKPKDPPAPVRDTSPQALLALQNSSQDVIGKLVKELDPQAHFVGYAAQSFVAFRQGIYLELSLNTNLPQSAAGSRYRLAALAFDDHVAHLIRPTLAYFKDETRFDGISFSATVHLGGKAPAVTSEAVEFFLPFSALHCYERYDCTEQQLLDAGTVLIDGERVGLDLQAAEGTGR